MLSVRRRVFRLRQVPSLTAVVRTPTAPEAASSACATVTVGSSSASEIAVAIAAKATLLVRSRLGWRIQARCTVIERLRLLGFLFTGLHSGSFARRLLHRRRSLLLRRAGNTHGRLRALVFSRRRGSSIVLFEVFEEVADVEERVCIASNVHEGRLHAGQHARDSTFVNASD